MVMCNIHLLASLVDDGRVLEQNYNKLSGGTVINLNLSAEESHVAHRIAVLPTELEYTHPPSQELCAQPKHVVHGWGSLSMYSLWDRGRGWPIHVTGYKKKKPK